ncbi:hypothetical protein ANCDUO_17210 [Ancylostoma duodenale]|uniref:Uncharacterized protein n=1 Tax=Ancylostoma duodenale TaxID=51022 RepID=A0A0C2G6J1_9BILA|nr:hypothetical protein ANCDUO_17210 [Ancylostoma duodenale]
MGLKSTSALPAGNLEYPFGSEILQNKSKYVGAYKSNLVEKPLLYPKASESAHIDCGRILQDDRLCLYDVLNRMK